MQSVVVSARPSSAEVDAIQHFVSVREAEIGYRPLSDQAWADLAHGSGPTLTTVQLLDEQGRLGGYAQATEADGVWTIEVVADADEATRVSRVAHRLIATIATTALTAEGTEINWLVQDPTALHDQIAATFGMTPGHRVHQMRRALPTGLEFEIDTRPFDVDRDLADWVRVNARAFVDNPQQGGWTEANVLARADEPWFDPEGFLIHDRDGRMAGFCWTKIHDNVTPNLGEIYVIAVDPDFHGLGLGRALTLAGLDSLARRGIIVGMLFVHADNATAVRLYERLGFVIHRTDCLYHGRLTSGGSS